MKNIYKNTFTAVVVLCFFATTAFSQLLHDNGPLVNSPGGGAGGADVSYLDVAAGLGTYGFGHQIVAFNRVADDFTVPAPGWDIDSLIFYAYQTGSTTTSTITEVNVAIWDAAPNAGGNIIWGDTTTNILSGSYWTGIYRTLDTDLLNTQRPIMADRIATAGLSLAAGTYWVSWQSGGTLASGPWAPPITISGTPQTGDALQFLGTGGTWAPIVDATFTQGLPFLIYGDVQAGGAACTDTALFAGLSVAIPDNDPVGVDDVQAVAGIPGTTLGVDVNVSKVCFKITHTWVGDLTLTLTSPASGTVVLFDRPGVPVTTVGCDGDDLDMCIVLGNTNDPEAVCGNLPAISGDYTAANGLDLDAINVAGGSPNGNWTLNINDQALQDTGTLTEWSILFDSGPSADWDPNPDSICATSGTINLDNLLTGTPGGTWSGTGVTGNTFDPTGLSGSIDVTYDITVGSCSASETHSFEVYPSAPTCGFSYNAVNTTVTFTNTSTGAVSYLWDFGDSQSSTAANPSNVYATNGNYTVTLSVTNPCGTTSCSQNITVAGCPDVIVDGGLEGGSPSAAWTEFSTNFGTPLCTAAGCGVGGGTGPNSGTWWAWFGGIATFEEGAMSQSITIPTNNTANLYFFLEVPVACDAPDDFLKVAVDADTVYTVDGTSPLCAVVGYSLQTVNLDTYADGAAHNLNFFSQIFGINGTGTNFFVDDISILACPVAIIEQSIADNISLQPNPASYSINVNLNGIKKGAKIDIVSIQGQSMFSKQVENKSTSYSENIDVTKWSKGVYMVTISNGEKTITEKIVIQ